MSSSENSSRAEPPIKVAEQRSLQSETIKLLEDLLADGFIVRIEATGNSMKPFLKGGETLHIGRCNPNSIDIGDVIFFKDKSNKPVFHRVINKQTNPNGELLLTTKGDNLNRPDHPVPYSRVYGKILAFEPVSGGNLVTMDSRLMRIKTKILLFKYNFNNRWFSYFRKLNSTKRVKIATHGNRIRPRHKRRGAT